MIDHIWILTGCLQEESITQSTRGVYCVNRKSRAYLKMYHVQSCPLELTWKDNFNLLIRDDII